MNNVILAAACVLLTAGFVFAQDEEPGKSEVMVWGGFAPAVRTFDAGGRTWDAQLGIGAVRYSRRFNNSDWVNLKYTRDASGAQNGARTLNDARVNCTAVAAPTSRTITCWMPSTLAV